MIKLDDNLLAELGLQSLPAEEKKALLRQIYETLEMRVGTTLARQMTDAQLDEFESFINNNDEAGALHWLETNFPNYKDVVAQEFETLKREIGQAAPQILANSAAQPQVQPQQQLQPDMPAAAPTIPDQQLGNTFQQPAAPSMEPAQPQYQQPQQVQPQPQEYAPAQPQQPVQPVAVTPQQQPGYYGPQPGYGTAQQPQPQYPQPPFPQQPQQYYQPQQQPPTAPSDPTQYGTAA